MSALQIQDLRVSHGSTLALDGVSFEVAPGELCALLGASGCGKTTLLRVVAGLVAPTSGQVRVRGRLVTDGARVLVGPRERRVGLVFQDYALFPDLTVRQNVGFSPAARPDDVDRLLHRAGLIPLADRFPRQLSGGQQQRVALARALAARPDVLLLDEPFANLDTSLRVALGAEVAALLADEGCAALLVTHDRADAMALAQRIAVMVPSVQGGRLAQHAPPATIWREPAEHAVAALMGPGTAVPVTGLGAQADSHLGTLRLAKPFSGAGEAWLRPTDLTVGGEGPWRVIRATFMGPDLELLCEKGEIRLAARTFDEIPVGTMTGLHARGFVWAWPR